MIKKLLQGLLKMITKLISLLLAPIDLAISSAFPDFSDAITKAVNGITILFENLAWPLSILPTSFHQILIIIFTLQLSYLTLRVTIVMIPRLLRVIQRFKFW